MVKAMTIRSQFLVMMRSDFGGKRSNAISVNDMRHQSSAVISKDVSALMVTDLLSGGEIVFLCSRKP